MIEISPLSKGNVLIIKAVGKLTDNDYKRVLLPALRTIITQYGKAKFLLDMGDEPYGWTGMALWDDALFGFLHRNDFEKMGVIGGKKWLDWGLRVSSLLIGGEMKTFPLKDRQEAIDWVKS